jgi:hypothetical protein
VDASFGSKCRVVGLSVDGSSRHRKCECLSRLILASRKTKAVPMR